MKFLRVATAISTTAILLIAARGWSGKYSTVWAAWQTASGGASDVIFIDHDKLAAALAKTTTELATGPGLRIYGAHRDGPGGVEEHETAADVFYVVEGEASIVTGGTLVDRKVAGPGELQGSDILGGQTHRLIKGDVIVIPAGTPHWFKDVPKSISYYVVKVVKPQ